MAIKFPSPLHHGPMDFLFIALVLIGLYSLRLDLPAILIALLATALVVYIIERN